VSRLLPVPEGGFRFPDRAPEDYPRPELNPFIQKHWDYGSPVITATQAQQLGGRWSEPFGRDAPLHLELGSGNGFYLAHMAGLHPERNWLGIELRFKRVVLTARKLVAAGVSNARIARYDAFMVDEVLPPGCLAGMHVNHPDPWPKERHAKNRLLARPFGELVLRLLQPGGLLRIKTDQRGYVDDFLAAIEDLPLKVQGVSYDTRNQGTPWPAEDDRITNYQRKFYDKGLPVCGLWVRRLPE